MLFLIGVSPLLQTLSVQPWEQWGAWCLGGPFVLHVPALDQSLQKLFSADNKAMWCRYQPMPAHGKRQVSPSCRVVARLSANTGACGRQRSLDRTARARDRRHDRRVAC